MNLLNQLKKSLFGERVAPADVAARVRSGQAVLVDVREPDEWKDGVAEKAVLLPLSDLQGPRAKWRSFLESLNGREVYVYCASGMRSGRAAGILNDESVKATNAGGLSDWAKSGWPIVRP